MLCAKFGWNWPSGSGEEDENVKSLQQRQRQWQRRRRTTDKFWSEKLTWAFGSGELKTHTHSPSPKAILIYWWKYWLIGKFPPVFKSNNLMCIHIWF